MKKRLWIIGGVIACLAVAAGLMLGRPKSDEALARDLVGTWRAVDPSNGALHKQKEAVATEQIIVQPDGNLLYTFSTKDAPHLPRTDKWGWRVRKGRLSIQFRGEEAVDDWMPSMRFNVSQESLSIMRKGFSPKEFSRASS